MFNIKNKSILNYQYNTIFKFRSDFLLKLFQYKFFVRNLNVIEVTIQFMIYNGKINIKN